MFSKFDMLHPKNGDSKSLVQYIVHLELLISQFISFHLSKGKPFQVIIAEKVQTPYGQVFGQDLQFTTIPRYYQVLIQTNGLWRFDGQFFALNTKNNGMKILYLRPAQKPWNMPAQKPWNMTLILNFLVILSFAGPKTS